MSRRTVKPPRARTMELPRNAPEPEMQTMELPRQTLQQLTEEIQRHRPVAKPKTNPSMQDVMENARGGLGRGKMY